MRTERQIHASRENGRKSRGPVTPEGKARSARTPARQTLLARNLLLDRESEARFQSIADGLHDEFQPETPAETAAVEAMAWSRWRQLRLWTFEQAVLNAEISRVGAVPLPARANADQSCNRAGHAFASLGDRSNAISLINRCETSYDRQFTRAFRRFLAIRAARERNLEKNNARSQQPVENKHPAVDFEPGPIPV